MSALEEIKIELKGIASVLKERNSFVPKYQRSYAWKTENVMHFLQDIAAAIQSSTSEYFLGSIVISQRDDDKPEIVDGQQRLATTCILLSAIRDYFYTLGTDEGKERAQMIFNEYLAKKDLDTLELISKLHLNDSDHEYFLNTIISNPGTLGVTLQPTKRAHERILEAATCTRKYVQQLAGVTADPTKVLIQWINYLSNKVKVIVVRVPDESNAFTIFETLNDRGLALAVSDLLKNYLFFKSEDRVSEAQHSWIQMIATIEAAEDEQAVVNFIRYHWSSKNGVIREKELFDRIKKHITSKSEALAFSSELQDRSKAYAAIVTCDDNFWSDFSPSTKIAMQTLNFFNITQLRPLLLSMLANFERVEVEKTLKILVSWSVRYLIVGGLGGGALEEKYCNAAVKIYKKEITDARQLSDYMQGSIPNDSEFKASFENATVSKNYLARYYLRTLEMVAEGNAEPEFVPNTSNDIVTLEHILPQNPSAAWGYIESDDAKANYKRIGNMVLLKKSINNGIGNAGFKEKTEFYGASDFKLTSEVAECPVWGLAEIHARQVALAELALLAWPHRI